LLAALDKAGIAHDDLGEAATISVVDRQQASTVLAALVKAGVAVDSFASAGSALEQTYLAMNEERR
jgi:hypothetical protein